MQTDKIEIFISHSSENLYLVDQFTAMLKNAGIYDVDIFCSSRNGEGVKSGDKINDTIIHKLKSANFILYLISNDFLNSIYCMQELGMSNLVNGHPLFLIVPDISIEELKGFINSKIHKFTLLNSPDAIEQMLAEINGNGIQSNISSNSIRTFLSATEHYYSQLIERRKRQNEDVLNLRQELAQLKQEKAEFQAKINKRCDFTSIELYESLFDYGMFSPDLSPSTIKAVGKDFWFGIKKDYEKLCTKQNVKISIMMCFAFMHICTEYDLMEDAYNYLINGAKQQQYLYLFQFEDFLDKYQKSMLTLITELNSISNKMEPSGAKDEVENIIKKLLEREKAYS